MDSYYGYNFNKVDPQLRSFDVQHNTLSLSAAEVNFTKTPTADSRVGFRTDVWFGKAADLTAAYEPASDGKEIYKHLQQAYVSLLTGKVQWDARQVRDADGRRGDRVAGQLELLALDPLRLRDPVLPRGPARDLHRRSEAGAGCAAGERLEQRQREQQRQDRAPEPDPEAEREPHLDRELHVGKEAPDTAWCGTCATCSTPPSRGPRLRS